MTTIHGWVLTLLIIEVAFCQSMIWFDIFLGLLLNFIIGLSSSGYIAYPAALKQATLWHKVIINQTSGPWPNLFTQRNSDPCPTLEAPGDELPIGRIKRTRAVGSVGKVKFVPTGRGRRQNPYYAHTGHQNAYTGIFQGASYGIVRISTFFEPKPNCDHGPCIPLFAMGLKFLRDGVESASVVAQYKEGQKSWNVFKHSWSNHVSEPTSIRRLLGRGNIPKNDHQQATLSRGSHPRVLNC